ncbi:MAG: uncharacterized protein A8A55_3451, partial [Amphiamblys sp. WSBS2006]
ETNALVENISQGIESAREMKQKIGEMITQKETIMKTEVGYQKLVFEEDSKHGEQSEIRESEEQPITECRFLEEFKEYCKYEEQRESKKSSEQPSTGCQVFEEEDYNRLEESVEVKKILGGVFSPEENFCSQDEEVVNTRRNHF